MTDSAETYAFGDMISYKITHADAGKVPTLAAGDEYPAIVIKKVAATENAPEIVLVDVFIPGAVICVNLSEAPAIQTPVDPGAAFAAYLNSLTTEEKQALLAVPPATA
jgi:hypothetical protein